jgi:hypothetical protein
VVIVEMGDQHRLNVCKIEAVPKSGPGSISRSSLMRIDERKRKFGPPRDRAIAHRSQRHQIAGYPSAAAVPKKVSCTVAPPW